MADGSKKSGARPFFRGGNLREFCTRALHTCAVSRRKLAYGYGILWYGYGIVPTSYIPYYWYPVPHTYTITTYTQHNKN